MKHLRNILWIFFSLSSAVVCAQINLRPGFVITNSNDTIYGSIDFRTAERNARQCSFQELTTGKTVTYYPGDIYAYRFVDDGKFYVTRTVTIDGIEETLFLEYIIQGIVSLYYYPGHFSHFFFETEEGKLIEMSQEEKEITDDEGRRIIKTDTRYLGKLTYIFYKSEKIKKKISRKPTLNKDYLGKLTKDYHSEVCESGQQCIEFEAKKDKRYVKLEYTLLAGANYQSFILGETFTYWKNEKFNSASPTIGFDLGLSIPRLTNVCSLHAAVHISQLIGKRDAPSISYSYGYEQFTVNTFMLDTRIGLRVNPFHGKCRPYLEAGLNRVSFLATDASRTYEQYKGHDIVETKIDYSNQFPVYCNQYYVQLGLVLPLSKHAISCSAYYQKGGRMDVEFKSIGLFAGFTF